MKRGSGKTWRQKGRDDMRMALAVRAGCTAARSGGWIEPLETRTLLTSYVVNSLSDTVADDGVLTLREAVQAANTDSPVNEAAAGTAGETDTISFAPSLYSGGAASIKLGGSELQITGSLAVHGPGAGLLSIDADGQSRVLNIASPSATVSLEGLTITGGMVTGEEGAGIRNVGTLTLSDVVVTANTHFHPSSANPQPGNGGGVYSTGTLTMTGAIVSNNTISMGGVIELGNWAYANGAGVYSSGQLTVTDSTFTGNKFVSTGVMGGSGCYTCGAAIYSTGRASVRSVTISDQVNTSEGDSLYNGGTMTLEKATISRNFGRALENEGTLTMTDVTISDNAAGGIYNNGSITATRSTISGNAGYRGGGIYNQGSWAQLTLSNVIISDNTAREDGGGIYNQSGAITMTASAIFGNTAAGSGGGLYDNGISGGSIAMTNATIFGNSAVKGGGVYQGVFWGASGTLSMTNVTISSNTAMGDGGGLYHAAADNVVARSTVINTIIAANIAPANTDVSGAFGANSDYNLIGTLDAAQVESAGTHTLFGRAGAALDAGLTPIMNTKGSWVFPLLPSSPAVNAGSNPLSAGERDQIGQPRIASDVVDIGAYEYQWEARTAGSISGTAFNDFDQDGVRDTGEPALAGVVVYLDANANGSIDVSEVSQRTNTDGRYEFTRVVPGNWSIRQVPQTGWRQTSGRDGLAITLDETEVSTGNDLGGVTSSWISGTAFRDLDINGMRDADEPGLPGRTVYIDANDDGSLNPGEMSTLTDGNGAYHFDGLAAGSYKLRQVSPAGWRQTMGAAGLSVVLATDGQVATGSDFGASRGTVYLVNSLSDVIAPDGEITLREAIAAANANAAVNEASAGDATDADVIQFEPSLFAQGPRTIKLDGSQLEITSRLVIQGPGADLLSVDADSRSRVFSISGRTTVVSIAGLTITGGNIADGDGAGLFNAGTVTMCNVVVTGNTRTLRVPPAGTPAYGGGIHNTGSLTMSGATVSKNKIVMLGTPPTVASSLTGFYVANVEGYGAGVSNGGALSMIQVTIRDNSFEGSQLTSYGAGVHNSGTLEMQNVVISGNVSISEGGGVSNAGALRMSNTTVSENTARNSGGGIRNSGTMTVVDATIRGNSAGDGGGIYNGAGTAILTGGTISGNSAGQNGGGVHNLGELMMANVIIVGNKVTSSGGWFAGRWFGGYGGGICNAGPKLAVVNAAVLDNVAASAGGGVYNGGKNVTMANVTIAGNSAVNGGGVCGRVTMRNMTISGNTATAEGGGVYNVVSYIVGQFAEELTVANSIVAGNVAANGPDVAGPVSAASDYNLIGVFAGAAGSIGEHSRYGSAESPLDAKLGRRVTINGMPVLPLLAGSPGVDCGSNALALNVDGKPLTTDATGYARINGDVVDLGAMEYRELDWESINGSGVKGEAATVIGTASPLGSITGCVFRDLNGDGVRQIGTAALSATSASKQPKRNPRRLVKETGLAGWRVFIDADNDGILDKREKSVLTNKRGLFAFKNVPIGQYTIRVVARKGYKGTNAKRGLRVNLKAGHMQAAANFGQKA